MVFKMDQEKLCLEKGSSCTWIRPDTSQGIWLHHKVHNNHSVNILRCTKPMWMASIHSETN